RICTRTDLLLRQAPLLVGLHGEKNGAPGRNFARNLRVRSAALYTLSYGSIWRMVRRDGSAPSASSMSVRRSTIDLPAHGAAPRICTGTFHVLNVVPLLLG